MSERTLTCRDCAQEFVFTTGEQEFYQQRGFSDPQRCPACRASRKTQRNATGGGSGGYSNDGGSGGGYSSGGGGGYSSGGGGGYSSGGNSGGGYSSGGNDRGGFSSAPRQLYPATCSECGQQTEVPFAPTPGKPVYCRDCFQSRKSSATSYDRW